MKIPPRVANNGHNKIIRSGGFTLIELLIALTVLSLLVGLLFAGLRMGDRTWRAVEDKSVHLDEMRLVWSFIDSRIRDFQPVQYDYEGERRLLFSGDKKAIEFISTSSYQNGFGGLYIIRLQLVPDQKERALLLRQWLYQPSVLEGGGDFPEWKPLFEDSAVTTISKESNVNVLYSESVLLERVESMEIGYWGAADISEEANWKAEWSEKIKLPTLIKINLKANGVEWPEMAFAPISVE
jgi:general secretion pathway protein J